MPSQILEPTNAAGVSTDVTVAAGSTNTVAMYTTPNSDSLLLPSGDDFFLPDGTSFLLLSPQASQVYDKSDYAVIQLKDPAGNYHDSGMYLRHNGTFKTLGPGVWRLSKPATPREFGFQSE